MQKKFVRLVQSEHINPASGATGGFIRRWPFGQIVCHRQTRPRRVLPNAKSGMKYFLVGTFSLLMSFSILARTDNSPELISNGGFEEPTTDQQLIPKWDISIPPGPASRDIFVLDNEAPHSGAQCLRINQATAPVRVAASAEVQPGRDYDFAFWARGASEKQSLDLQLDFGQIKGKHTYTFKGFKAGKTWQRCLFRFRTPAGAQKVYLRITVSAGQTWIDDVSCRESVLPVTPEAGQFTAAFESGASSRHKTVIVYPAYRLETSVSAASGFSGISVYWHDRLVFRMDGFGLDLGKGKKFYANRPLTLFIEKDESGRKEICWGIADSEDLSYRGILIARPRNISISQDWIYKKSFRYIQFWWGMALPYNVFEYAQYLVSYAQGAIHQGALSYVKNEWHVLEDAPGGGPIKNAVFYTPIGIIKYGFGFRNISPSYGRIYATENKNDPKSPNLGISMAESLEVGGEAGESRGWNVTIDFPD